MPDFKRITLQDREIIEEYLTKAPSMQLIACFEAYYLWREVYDITYAIDDDNLIFKLNGGIMLPCGKDSKTFAEFKILKSRTIFNGRQGVASRDNAEYIYSVDKFRSYSGQSLQSKRNFVNYVKSNFDWQYEELSDCGEAIEFVKSFRGDDSFTDDNQALVDALSDYDKLSLNAGLIRIEGAIIALFVVSPLSDMRCAAGLFLRARHDIKGVIPLLYQEFFKVHTEYNYVNLAEDLGIEGLRKNKLSYKPDTLLELYDLEPIR